jgi:23S rRNA (adenine2030-N6)-methyltransferase
MNYRHAYHAGSFADVIKHATVARIIEYLKRKEHAFRVIDTHAGTGRYDLSSEEAEKTDEWHSGIGRLLDARSAAKSPRCFRPIWTRCGHRTRTKHFPAIPARP